MRKIQALVLVFLGILLLLCPTTAYAATLNLPDTTDIISAEAWRHNLEDDDFLVILHYEISYTVPGDQPDDDAEDTFLIRLMDGNTSLGVVTPYPLYNDGYGEAASALYFDSDDAPAWMGNYTLHLAGNPSLTWAGGTAPSATYNMDSDDYSTKVEEEDIQDDIADYIIDIADDLDSDWGLADTLYEYVQAGLVLTEVLGEPYFVGAIPGLWYFCPQLFSVQTLQPEIGMETYTQAQADAYAAEYDDTIIGDWTTNLGNLFGGMAGQTATTLVVMCIWLGAMMFCAVKFQKATPGFLICAPILLLATPAGMYSFIIVGIVSLFCALLLGYLLFFRNATG